jgi:hypothetical protein
LKHSGGGAEDFFVLPAGFFYITLNDAPGLHTESSALSLGRFAGGSSEAVEQLSRPSDARTEFSSSLWKAWDRVDHLSLKRRRLGFHS